MAREAPEVASPRRHRMGVQSKGWTVKNGSLDALDVHQVGCATFRNFITDRSDFSPEMRQILMMHPHPLAAVSRMPYCAAVVSRA